MQKRGAIGALAALTTAVSGCASVIEGRSQQISVNTSPPGAECGFYREEGIRIAFDPRDTRPGAGREDQERHLDRLREAGLSATTYLNHSGVSGAAFVNIIGGIFTLGISTVIGAAVDSSNGSHNLYQSPVNMGMAPNATGTSEGPAVLPQTFSAAKPAQAWSQQVAAPAGVVSTPGEPTRQQNECCGHRGRSAAGATCQQTGGPCRSCAAKGSRCVAGPRGSRPVTFTWKPDNTMTATGPRSNDPTATFRNEGACAKT